MLDPRLGRVGRGQVQVDLHRVVRREREPGVGGERGEPEERGDPADARRVGLHDAAVAGVDQRHVLRHRGQHLAGRDRGVERTRQVGVADRVPGVERLLDPDQVELLQLAAHPAGAGAVPLLVGVDHQRGVTEVLADRGDTAQVLGPVGLTDLDLDAADTNLERGGGLLLDLLDARLEEAARGVVDAAGVAVGAEQLGQRQSGAPGLEVVERHVEGGHGLGRDTAAPDRGAGPHQRLVDLGDVGGVLADGDLGDLLEVGVLRRAAGPLGVAEAHALEALLGRHLDEEKDGLGERLLPPGEHLGVADRVLEREDDVGKGQ